MTGEATHAPATHAPATRSAPRDVALIDLLDRLLEGGVVVQGEIMLAAAGIDLVALDLRLLVSAIDTLAGS